MFIHSTSTFASGGRSGRIRSTSACTRWSACCMSVPHVNSALISVDPREVADSTRRTPGTRRTASSRGRVDSGIIRAAGSSPTSVMTLTIGNVTAGKIDAGDRNASKTPPVPRTATTRKIAAPRSRARRARLIAAEPPRCPRGGPPAPRRSRASRGRARERRSRSGRSARSPASPRSSEPCRPRRQSRSATPP